MPDLALYQQTSCPYCAKVRKFMEREGISIPIKDISDSEYRQELMKIGGKQQVPCLVIDDKALYESEHIIDWLKANYK